MNDAELLDVYIDAGISGRRSDTRPELQKALNAVCKGKAVLVVFSLARLARSTADTLAIAKRLDSSGADLASISERIDTTTAAGKMIFRLLAVLAEFESDLIAERTSTAMQHKRSLQQRVGKVPFGFSLADDGNSLIPIADEQATLALIAELRADGQSFRQIAATLTSRGVKTKDGNAIWRHSSVARILGRPAV